MPTGVPKAGYRKTKWREAKSREEIEKELAFRTPEILAELEKLTKAFPCPHCGNEIRMIDKDVGIYLVDRVLGKPKQRTEVDLTENIQLNADQIAEVIARHPVLSKICDLVELIAGYPEDKVIQILTRAYEIAKRELLTEGVIEGEVKELSTTDHRAIQGRDCRTPS